MEAQGLPEISRFFGIVVGMYYADHPPPHFHVRYGDHRATIAIEPPRLIEGRLSPRVLGLVIEWAALHRNELLRDWSLAQSLAPLEPIPPLE